MSISPIGALRVADPKAWVKRIRDAMKETGGRIHPAAAILEVSPRTLFRWLADDAALAAIEKAPPCLHESPKKKRTSRA